METNNPFSRRDFIKTMSLAGASAPFISMTRPQFKKNRLSDPDAWKIYLFSKHFEFLDYDEAAEATKELGFDGVDLTVRRGGHVLPENVTRDLPRAVNAFEKKGLKVKMMASNVSDAQDQYTEPVLKTASELGIQYYRLSWYKYGNDMGMVQSLMHFKKKLEKLGELNSKYGINGCYQNHCGRNFVGAPVWDLWMLIKDFDPQIISSQYDIHHATVEGGMSWPLGFNLLQHHIKTIAIKDFKWKDINDNWPIIEVPLGQGWVDFDTYFEKLKALNVQAPITLHVEYPLFKSKHLSKKEKRKQASESIQKDLEYVKGLLQKHGLKA